MTNNKKPTPKKERVEDGIKGLAKLSRLEYDLVRREFASTHNMSLSVLDAEVKERRSMTEEDNKLVEELTPWEQPVDGKNLVSEIKALLERHVVLPTNTSLPIALWVLLTYTYDAFLILPILLVVSPEKRCGKSTLLDLLNAVCHRAVSTSSITPAVIYRLVERTKPTLLVDEADTFLPKNEALRGILNAGHRKGNAWIFRSAPKTHEPERFSTWCPKCVFMIGTPPDTIEDRSVMVKMQRKMADETVESIPFNINEEYLKLRRKCLRWAEDNYATLISSKPVIPYMENDRAKDNWLPLITIAESIGEKCYKQAIQSLEMHTKLETSDSYSTMLLEDLKIIFEDNGRCNLRTEDIVRRLNNVDDRPWPGWNKGFGIKPHSISKLLKNFGIKSKKIRIGVSTCRGYKFEDFTDVFSRYLSPLKNGTVEQDNNINDLHENKTGTWTPSVPSSRKHNLLESQGCSGVPLSRPHDRRNNEKLNEVIEI